MAASIPSATRSFFRCIGTELWCSTSYKTQSKCFTRALSTDVVNNTDSEVVRPKRRAEKLSAAMKAFLKRAKDHESKINKYTEEYELGRKHLANMMGIHPDEMTQEHINEAVRYLLPSGLFDKGSRPQFKHPKDILPLNFEFPFDKAGKPYHYQYYTLLPNYYGVMSEAAWRVECLRQEEVRVGSTGAPPTEEMKHLSEDYEWMDMRTFFNFFKTRHSEVLQIADHKRFEILMTRLSKMRLREQDVEFLKQFGAPRTSEIKVMDAEEMKKYYIDEQGRKFRTKNGYRKTAVAQVTVYAEGTGIFEINGTGIEHFESQYAREQVLFPLVLTNKMNKVDVHARVEGGGEMGQSGAIRHGLSNAILPFVSQQMVNKLSLSGLLDRDSRVKERKKPGQKKARKKFQWRAR